MAHDLTDFCIETFYYFVDGKCIGIKRHKDKNGECRWVGDGCCKIFKEQFIKDFDKIYKIVVLYYTMVYIIKIFKKGGIINESIYNK